MTNHALGQAAAEPEDGAAVNQLEAPADEQQPAKSPLQKQHSARRPGPASTSASAVHALEAAAAASPAPQGHTDSDTSQQLQGVWHHLKQLEKAVKSHLHPAAAEDTDRGSNAAQSQAASGALTDSSSEDSSREASPTAASSARMSRERAKLRDSLSKIKSEIADKTVKAVEAQLLQQRVACLEAALSGLTGSGMLAATGSTGTGAGCTSCGTSFAGSMLSLGGRASAVCLRCSIPGHPPLQQQQQQPQQQQQAPRTSAPMRLDPGVSQLYDRLGDMEAVMRELAHAQATSSSVLSELGGRLSTAAGAGGGVGGTAAWPASSHAGIGSTSPLRGSLLRRPPSCPISEGPLACWSFCSPPAQRPSCSMGLSPTGQHTHRPSSACTMHGPPASSCHATAGGFSSVLSNPVFSPESPGISTMQTAASPARGAGGGTGTPAAAGVPSEAQPPSSTPGTPAADQPPQQPQQQQLRGSLMQQAAQQHAQQVQEQHHYHLDVVLASHDAELACVKDAVSRLESAQHVTASVAEDTALHTASLDDRLRVLEHGWPALVAATSASAAPGPAPPLRAAVDDCLQEHPQQDSTDLEATLSRGIACTTGEAQADRQDISAAGCLPSAEAGSPADSAADSSSEPATAEGLSHLHARVASLESASARQQQDIQHLQAELHQTYHAVSMVSLDTAGRTAAAAIAPVAHAPRQQAVTLSSADQAALVQQLLSSKLLQEVITARVQHAVEAQLAANNAAETQQGDGIVTIAAPAVCVSSESPIVIPSQQPLIEPEVLPPPPQLMPSALQITPVASSRATSGFSHEMDEAAEQQLFMHNMLQQLHGRLLTVESTVLLLSQRVEQQQQQPEAVCGAATELSGVVDDASAKDSDDGVVASEEAAPPPAAVSSGAQLAGLSQIHAQLSAAPETAAAKPDTTSGEEEPAASTSTTAAMLSATPSAVYSSRFTSATQIEQQVAALQDEVEGYQVQEAMQAALNKLSHELHQLQQLQAEQALLIDGHKISTGASVALLMPLEPKVERLSGQVGGLESQVAVLLALVSQQPERFEVLQGEIEQLSQHLAEVSEAAAEEADVDSLKEQLAALQQQHSQLQAELESGIRAATEAAAAAAVMASAAAEAAADAGARTQEQLAAQQQGQEHTQLQGEAAEAIIQRLAAVESPVQHLSSMHGSLTELQEKVDGRMVDAKQAAAAAAAVSQQQQEIIDTLTQQTSELAVKLRGVHGSVGEQLAQLAATSDANAVATAATAVAANEVQLQGQLADVRAELSAATESHSADLRLQLLQQAQSLEQQLAGVQAAAAAAGAEHAAVVEAQLHQQAAELNVAIAAAVEAQDAGMRQQLQQQAEAVAEQIAEAQTAAAERAAAIEEQLQAQAGDLRTAFTEAQEAHDADLKQQLSRQVDMMSQILADVGCYKAEQADASRVLREELCSVRQAHDASHTEHSAQLEQLTDALQLTAQQLKDELTSSVTPLQSQLQVAAVTLAEHGTALEGSRSVADAVQVLSSLPAATAELSARLDELAQAQRAAEGELSANKEHSLVLDTQIGAAVAQLQALEAAVAANQEQESQQLQQLRQDLIEPVVQELARLQAHKQQLQKLQQDQALAVERLGDALESVKGDVLLELANERQQLSQAVEELQAVVEGQCVKTDQLGTIFAARDNMYNAWLQMQALFDANKTRRGTSLFGAAGRRLSTAQDHYNSGSSPSASIVTAAQRAHAQHSDSAAGAAQASQPRAAGAASILLLTDGDNSSSSNAQPSSEFDPFSELINRADCPTAPEQPASQNSDNSPADGGGSNTDAPTALAAAAAAAPGAHDSPTVSIELTEVAEAQCQLREEVGSLAIQLHAAMADLSEQVSALRRLQHNTHHLQQPSAPEAAEAVGVSHSNASAEYPPGSSSSSTAERPLKQAAPQMSAAQSDGVLHAPLSVVLQLQQELAGMKEAAVSKEQFAAVVRMVKELRSHQTAASSDLASPVAHSASRAVDADASSTSPEPASAADSAHNVSAVLQQHAEQLAAVEALLQGLSHKAAAAEAVVAEQQGQVLLLQEQQQQQQADPQVEQLGGSVARLEAALQQQGADLAAGLDSISTTQQQVQELSGQHTSMQAELQKVSAYVTELAAKLHSAANAAALAVRPHGSGDSFSAANGGGGSGGGSGFSEMVGGLTNLKACLDQQAKAVADLSTRLEDQDSVLQRLVDSVAQHNARTARGSTGGGSDVLDKDATASRTATADSHVSKAQLDDLAGQLVAVQQKLAALELQQPMLLLGPEVTASAEMDAAQQDPTTAVRDSSDAGSAGGGHPLGFLHGMLVELRKRLDKVEEDSMEAKATATAAAATASTAAAAAATAAAASTAEQAEAHAPPTAAAVAPAPATLTSRQPAGVVASSKRGQAGRGPNQNAAAGLPELQEWLVTLQAEVTRLNAQDTSIAATVESLRGDVGAAAAAAAAAAIAASTVSAAPAASISALEMAEETLATEQHIKQASGVSSLGASDSGAKAAAACSASLWAAVEKLKLQVEHMQEVESTAAAALWASGGSNSGDSKTNDSMPQLDAQQIKQELLAELSAMQAAWQQASAATAAGAASKPPHLSASAVRAGSPDEAAVALLSERVIELQVMVAEVATQAAEATTAAAAAVAASKAALSRTQAAAASMTAAPASPAQPSGEQQQQQQSAGEVAVTTLQGVNSGAPLPRCLSFGDLANSNNGGTAGAAPQASVPAAESAAPSSDPVGSTASEQGDGAITRGLPLASSATPSRQASDSAGGASLRSLSRSSTSSSSRGSSWSDRSSSSKLSVRQLLEEMSSLPAVKQVAIVSKLAGLVSTHAARLLVTYSDDPQLSSQLQAVQQQLSAAVQSSAADAKASASSPSAAAGAAAGDGSSGALSVRGSRSRAAVGSTSLRHSSSMLASSGAAAGSSSEALLCILDQVASLRAIGSTTHPAISDTLHKHEAQLAELREAQQAIQAAIAVMAAGSSGFTASVFDAALEGAAAASPPSGLRPTAAAAASEGLAAVGEQSQQRLQAEGSSEAAATPSTAGSSQQPEQQLYEGELGHRLADVEARLAAGLRVLSAVRNKLPPLQVVADATQGMMRELQVAQGLALQRLEALEGLAASGVTAATTAASGAEATGLNPAGGGVLAVAGSMKKLQEDLQAASRRLTSLEASVASQVPECLALSRRLAARQANAEARNGTVTDKVSSLASSLSPLVERVAELESRLHRSLAIAKQGLDILADQLVALGAMNGRGSPNKKNPLAALGPHHAAITALEGKVEAVRTAMTASVKLMIEELAGAVEDCEEAGSIKAAMGATVGPAGTLAALKGVAEQAARAAAASHDEAMMQLESKMAELHSELRATTARLDKQA